MNTAADRKTPDQINRSSEAEKVYIPLPGHSEYSGRFRFLSEDEPPRGSATAPAPQPAAPAEKK
jgi:hypothetical protein